MRYKTSNTMDRYGYLLNLSVVIPGRLKTSAMTRWRSKPKWRTMSAGRRTASHASAKGRNEALSSSNALIGEKW